MAKNKCKYCGDLVSSRIHYCSEKRREFDVSDGVDFLIDVASVVLTHNTPLSYFSDDVADVASNVIGSVADTLGDLFD